jgi:hypothetical protein
MPPQPIPAIQAAPPGLGTRPLWLLYTCTCLIIVVLIMADAAVSLHLRETALRGTETNLRNISLALAEQADRAVQGVDLVLSSTAEFVSTEQVEDAADFRRRMAERRPDQFLPLLADPAGERRRSRLFPEDARRSGAATLFQPTGTQSWRQYLDHLSRPPRTCP